MVLAREGCSCRSWYRCAHHYYLSFLQSLLNKAGEFSFCIPNNILRLVYEHDQKKISTTCFSICFFSCFCFFPFHSSPISNWVISLYFGNFNNLCSLAQHVISKGRIDSGPQDWVRGLQPHQLSPIKTRHKAMWQEYCVLEVISHRNFLPGSVTATFIVHTTIFF